MNGKLKLYNICVNHKNLQNLLGLGSAFGKITDFMASSNTSFSPTFVKAEHSMYFKT